MRIGVTVTILNKGTHWIAAVFHRPELDAVDEVTLKEPIIAPRRSRFFYGWVVVGISFLTLAVGGSTNGSFSIFYLAILKEFNWTRADTAVAFSLSMLVFSACGPLVGWH